MADPQTADQGFLAGLLGKFGADPAAAYGGLLSDPATQRQFALRSLGAAAQAFGQGAMPVPYKGGIPFGATLGAAGGAAATAGDELIKARLEQAQSEQALQNASALHAKQLATTEILKNYQDPNSIYNRGGGTGTGTGTGSTDGKPLTGPAKIIASQGGGAGGISPTDHYSFLLDNGASKNEATMLTSAANSESSFRPDLTHDGGIGYGLYGHNAARLAAMRAYAGVGPNDPVPWQQQALYALAELRSQVPGLPGGGEPKAGAMVNAATNSQQLTDAQLAFERPNLNIAGGNRAQRLASTTEYLDKPPYAQSPTQTASTAPSATPPAADLGPQTASGGAYSVPPPPGPPPKPGEYAIPVRAGNVPLPPAAPAPAAPPMAPPAASRGLLDTSQGPLGSSAAPPQLATPPAAGAPGPVTGLLGQQPTQQVAAADAPQLSPAAAAVLQGINRQQAGGGLLASGSVAGDNAVPSGEPPAVAQAGPPHTGAAGAAELAGLLAQQPAAAPPTATPYTNAPPVTGQGAPAPGPAPGPAPPAPPLAPGGAASPMPQPQPVTPSAIPGAPSAQDVRDANRAVILHGIAGIPLPPNINEIAKFPMVGPTAQATAAGTAAGNYPTQAALQQQKAAYDLWVAQNKPQEIRKGGMVKDPITGVITQNPDLLYSADPKTGAVHQWYSYPSTDPNVPPRVVYAGQKELGPGEKAKLEAGGKATETPIELSKDVMFPPGSAAANQWHDAQMRGEKLPGNVQILPNGSVQVTATQPTGDQIAKNQEEFGKLRDAAFDARNGAFEMQELRKTLNGMGAQGPATPFYSSLSSWAISLGLTSNADVKKYLGFSPADEAAAEKMSQDLLGAVLKAQFPQKITNADITNWKDTVPRGTMLRDAYDMLMDRVLMPKFEHTAGRYAAVAGLPNSGDAQLRTFNQTLETYDKAHPLTSYIHTYSYGAPDENGIPHRMRWVPSGPGRNQGDWVDDAKNPVKF